MPAPEGRNASAGGPATCGLFISRAPKRSATVTPTTTISAANTAPNTPSRRWIRTRCDATRYVCVKNSANHEVINADRHGGSQDGCIARKRCSHVAPPFQDVNESMMAVATP